ncbi:MAG TPA: hypothetical protein DCP98_02765 [Sphaerochaeta sp.]|nr:hypothetical protein [Sphaerochaeta sp.]
MALLVILVSCSESEDSINSGSGIKVDLTKLEGDEKTLTLSPNDTVDLSGVKIESLYLVEAQGASSGSSKALNPNISAVISSGPFIILPQEDGTTSFAGADIGISASLTDVKIKKAGNTLTFGPSEDKYNFVQIKLEPTEYDHKDAGEPRYLWPTYHNYIHIDFNNSHWSHLKDKRIVIVQNTMYGASSGSGRINYSSNEFGLIQNGRVEYSRGIKGLYDLSELDNDVLNLYTFARTSNLKGDQEYMRTYLILPETLSSTPFDIVGYPHVYLLPMTDESPYYEVTIDDVKRGNLKGLVGSLLMGQPRTIGENNNGVRIDKLLGIKEIVQGSTSDTFKVTLYIEGVGEDIIINSHQSKISDTDYFGEISMTGTSESWTPDSIIMDGQEHQVVLGEGGITSKTFYIEVPAEKNYNMHYTLSDNSKQGIIFECTNKRNGSGPVDANNTDSVYQAGMQGYITFCCLHGEQTITYKFTEN